jgi:hypothetical protein
MHRASKGGRGSVRLVFAGLVLGTLALLVLLGIGAPAMAAPSPAIGVADAALAQARNSLLASWPDEPDESLVFDGAAIRHSLSPALFPDPVPGLEPFASAVAYDDLTPSQPGITWDSNGNGLLVVDYRGASGAFVCSKRVFVQRSLIRPPLDVVLYTGGDLSTSGAGNNPKIMAEQWSSPQAITAYVAGLVDDPAAVDQSLITLVSGAATPPLDEVLPADWVSTLTALALDRGRYFTSFADAGASAADPEWAPEGGLSGLCVIRLPEFNVVQLPSIAINSPDQPGCLLLLGDGRLMFSGLTDYYGAVYTEGAIEAGHGAPTVHGMLVGKGSFDDRGAMYVRYNEGCVFGAAWPTAVDALEGTERWLDTMRPVSAQVGADDAWHPAPVTISFTAQDEFGGSGVAQLQHSVDAGTWTTGDSLAILTDGAHTVSYRAIDHAGNVEDTHTTSVKVDSVPPVTVASGVDDSWHASPVAVSLSATDAASGLLRSEYSIDGGASWTSASGLLVSEHGRHEIRYRSVDLAGHVEPAHDAEVLIDTQPPATTDDADGRWHNADVTVTLEAADTESGVKTTSYRIDDGAEQPGTSVLIPALAGHASDGAHVITYGSGDAAGNSEPARSCAVSIDTRRPATKVPYASTAHRGRTASLKYRVDDTSPNAGTATVRIKVTNAVGRVVRTLGPGVKTVNTLHVRRFRVPRTWRPGTYRFSVYATDGAGNPARPASNRLVIR